jgi:hypothetical protein
VEIGGSKRIASRVGDRRLWTGQSAHLAIWRKQFAELIKKNLICSAVLVLPRQHASLACFLRVPLLWDESWPIGQPCSEFRTLLAFIIDKAASQSTGVYIGQRFRFHISCISNLDNIYLTDEEISHLDTRVESSFGADVVRAAVHGVGVAGVPIFHLDTFVAVRSSLYPTSLHVSGVAYLGV